MESGCSFQLNAMRMAMKMAAVSTIAVLLLCSSLLASTDSQDTCDLKAVTQDTFAVPLNHKLQESDTLTWKYNKITIFNQKKGRIISGNKDDIYVNGSLKLKNVTKTQAGDYIPEVFDVNGRIARNLKVMKLCILDRVLKPKVVWKCTKSHITFTCKVKPESPDFKFSWFKTGRVSQNITAGAATFKLKDVETDSIFCEVSNGINALSSDSVQQNCTSKSFFPDKLFGINSWIVVGVGGGIVVILMIIVIVCCICNRRRNHMQLKDEEELRLEWTNTDRQQPQSQPQQHHHHPHNRPPNQQHHHHHHHHQQQPAGHTGPRQHRTKQPRPRAPNQSNGHPQPSPRRPAQAPKPVDNADDEQPPPLPQPRKKAPKTPRM